MNGSESLKLYEAAPLEYVKNETSTGCRGMLKMSDLAVMQGIIIEMRDPLILARPS